MRRRRSSWVLLLAAVACTPSGKSTLEDEPLPRLDPGRDDADEYPPARRTAGCGGLVIEGTGPWGPEHPAIAPLQRGWPPLAEYGTPMSGRDARSSWPAHGYDLVELWVDAVPRDHVRCYVLHNEDRQQQTCVSATEVIETTPPSERPTTARPWAELIASIDGAAAVFEHPADLEACGIELPGPVGAWSPGLRGTIAEPSLTIVERHDNPRGSTWVRVDLEHDDDGIPHLTHREIATTVRSDAEQRMSASIPAWNPDWPLAPEAEADDSRREVRLHPLWRTPIVEACPVPALSSLTPSLTAGPTLKALTRRLASNAVARFAYEPTDTVILDDHVDLPGTHVALAVDAGRTDVPRWAHLRCFVSGARAWCPDGTATDLQAMVDRFDLGPSSLRDAQWFELAVIMTAATRVVLEPSLLHTCTSAPGATAPAPTVRRTGERVAIELTEVTESGAGVRHEVTVERGKVRMATHPAWSAPKPRTF